MSAFKCHDEPPLFQETTRNFHTAVDSKTYLNDWQARLENDFYFYHKNLCNEHKVHVKRVTRTRKPVAEQMKIIKRSRVEISFHTRDDETEKK